MAFAKLNLMYRSSVALRNHWKTVGLQMEWAGVV